MSASERMSAVDTAWLRMDRPSNLMQIVGVMIFDGALDEARLRAAIEQRLLAHARFRQVVCQENGGYVWRDDPDFDLDHHLRRAILPGAGGQAELEHFVADLASTPLNPSRPLWEMHLVDTTIGGQALVTRIHHSIADGIALVGVLLSMADDSPQPLPRSTRKTAQNADGHDPFWLGLWRPATTVMLNGIRLSTNLWAKYVSLATNPIQALEYTRLGTAIAGEIGKLALMPNDSPTRFKGKPGASKRVAWSAPISLPEVKAVGRVLGCSVNDMLLSAAAGALRGYLADKGDAVDGVEIRALVPVNLRRPQDQGQLGNRFGLVALELPVGIENPLARLYATRDRMLALKDSMQAPLTLAILGAVGMAPKMAQAKVLDLLASKATAVMTNVPGPQQALYVAGARLNQPLFWVPQSGDIGMGVSILSYDNRVQFGLITDKGLVPDPEQVVARFASEFEKLLMLVLMEPWARLGDPQAVEAELQAG